MRTHNYNFTVDTQPILDLTKDTTIRPRRVIDPEPGDRLQFYTGLRTKRCRKIGTATCERVSPIVLYRYYMPNDMGWPTIRYAVFYDHKRLDHYEVLEIATRDGFADVQSFLMFFEGTYGVPDSSTNKGLALNIIKWRDFKPA